MACLPRNQLARLALGQSPESHESAHLDECDRCQRNLEALRSEVQELAGAHAWFDRGHAQARERLLAALPATRRGQHFSRTGGLTMTQRLAFGGAAAVILVAVGLIGFAVAPKPAYAMGQVAQSIRQAKSYEYTMTTEMSLAGEPGKAPIKVEMKGKFSWLAPGSYRMELHEAPGTAFRDLLTILPAGKPGIEIDRKAKKYVRQPARLGQISPLMMVEKLSMFSGQADRLLGTKEIDGKSAKGFEIQARKID